MKVSLHCDTLASSYCLLCWRLYDVGLIYSGKTKPFYTLRTFSIPFEVVTNAIINSQWSCIIIWINMIILPNFRRKLYFKKHELLTFMWICMHFHIGVCCVSILEKYKSCNFDFNHKIEFPALWNVHACVIYMHVTMSLHVCFMSQVYVQHNAAFTCFVVVVVLAWINIITGTGSIEDHIMGLAFIFVGINNEIIIAGLCNDFFLFLSFSQNSFWLASSSKIHNNLKWTNSLSLVVH